jgi:hypothetical protein
MAAKTLAGQSKSMASELTSLITASGRGLGRRDACVKLLPAEPELCA